MPKSSTLRKYLRVTGFLLDLSRQIHLETPNSWTRKTSPQLNCMSLRQILHLAHNCSLSWVGRVRQWTKHDVQKSLPSQNLLTLQFKICSFINQIGVFICKTKWTSKTNYNFLCKGNQEVRKPLWLHPSRPKRLGLTLVPLVRWNRPLESATKSALSAPSRLTMKEDPLDQLLNFIKWPGQRLLFHEFFSWSVSTNPNPPKSAFSFRSQQPNIFAVRCEVLTGAWEFGSW